MEEKAAGLPIDINLCAYEIHNRSLEKQKFKNLDPSLFRKLLPYIVEISHRNMKDSEDIIMIRNREHFVFEDGETTEVGAKSCEKDDYDRVHIMSDLSNKELMFSKNNYPPIDPNGNKFREISNAPDFTKIKRERNLVGNSLYGKLKAIVVLVRNKEINYLFLETPSRKVFLALAEFVNSRISRYGI